MGEFSVKVKVSGKGGFEKAYSLLIKSLKERGVKSESSNLGSINNSKN